MAHDTTDERNPDERLADAAERIAAALEAAVTPPSRKDPMAVDQHGTHKLVTEYKDRTGIKDV